MLQTSAYKRISNANKFSNKTGVVHFALGKQGGEVMLKVTDQGIGRSAEQLARVRNPQAIYSTFGT